MTGDGQRKRVVFILSLGRSGSTVLGYLLNAHPKILHIGEVVSPLDRQRAFECLHCGAEECPLWGTVLTETFVRECVDSARVSCGGGVFNRLRRLIATGKRMPVVRGQLHQRVFDSFPGVDVIVDGSKQVFWADWNAGTQSFDVRFLFMVRDLRATVNSMRRSRPGLSVREATVSAVRQLRRIEAFLAEQNASHILKVRYEELVVNTEREAARVCGFVGVPFVHDMLQYSAGRQCVIGGNAGPAVQSLQTQGRSAARAIVHVEQGSRAYYGSLGSGLSLDMRWVEELSEEDRGVFEDVGGEVNRMLGYGSE